MSNPFNDMYRLRNEELALSVTAAKYFLEKFEPVKDFLKLNDIMKAGFSINSRENSIYTDKMLFRFTSIIERFITINPDIFNSNPNYEHQLTFDGGWVEFLITDGPHKLVFKIEHSYHG